MTQPRTEHRSVSRLLAAIALLLGLLVADRWADRLTGGPIAGESAALAQGPEEHVDGRVSAAEQRKDMIAELRGMNRRLEKIEATLSKPLAVKVLEMPREPEKK